MEANMTQAARRELVDAILNRYRAASGKPKRKILKELSAVPASNFAQEPFIA